MNRSQPIALILALLPCAALLAGCPDEKKADPADSSTAIAPSASVAVAVTTPIPPPLGDAGSATDAGKDADAGPAADAGKDAGKPAAKK